LRPNPARTARAVVVRYRLEILRVASALEQHAVVTGEAIGALVFSTPGD
jgi:hypothetical protein